MRRRIAGSHHLEGRLLGRSQLLPLAYATLFGLSQNATAGVCTVPGSHPSIQAAIGDPDCSEIQLSNQTYFELLEINRSLALFGPTGGSARVLGQLTLSGALTVAVLNDFRIESGCPNGALRITGGARAIASAIELFWARNISCSIDLIHEDGFES